MNVLSFVLIVVNTSNWMGGLLVTTTAASPFLVPPLADSFFFLLFLQKQIYNRHINKMKKCKTKIYITVIRCKATITPEIKLKE